VSQLNFRCVSTGGIPKSSKSVVSPGGGKLCRPGWTSANILDGDTGTHRNLRGETRVEFVCSWCLFVERLWTHWNGIRHEQEQSMTSVPHIQGGAEGFPELPGCLKVSILRGWSICRQEHHVMGLGMLSSGVMYLCLESRWFDSRPVSNPNSFGFDQALPKGQCTSLHHL